MGEQGMKQRLRLWQSANFSWERWDRVIGEWVPYLTLALSAILSQISAGQDWSERAGTAGLITVSVVWVFLLFSRSPKPREGQRLRMRVYFAGLMVLGALLMARQPIFFVFTLTGFFHAAVLRPRWLTILGVAATSILINTVITGFPWAEIEYWFLFVTIIVVQTLAIGFGIVISEKLAEQSEQRRQAVARLEAALEENAGLQAQLVAQAREAGVLDERQRMAREIHDTIAQGLTGIITQLEAVEQARERPEDWQRHLNNAARLARESLSEARRSVEASRPESLENAPLPEALAEVARQWSAMNGVAAQFRMTGEPVQLHPEVEVTLLRTAQEALANVAKHAHASRAGLTLSYMGDVVVLDVRDNGVGFEVANGAGRRGAGFGLIAMRQRVNRVAGTLDIESEPGGGTAISARVPAIVAQQEAPKS
jgi:signal transduction histidine kinase